MPPRHYRTRLRNISKPTTIFYSYQLPLQTKCIDDTFQTQLFNIIEVITQRLEISEITTQVNNLVNSISDRLELYKLLDTVETISISIVQNITDGIDIGIIKCRIDYLRTLISQIPEGSQEDYAQVGNLILGVLSMISDGIDNILVSQKIVDIKESVDVYTNSVTIINEIYSIICSIVQNITDGIDIGIIRCRIEYLNSLIGKLSECV